MVLDLLKKGIDPTKAAGDPAEVAKGAEALAEPLAAFLNPETGQATAVKPDPAGWPKAEVAPGLPGGEDPGKGAPDLLAEALSQAPGEAAAAPAAAEGLKAPVPDLPAPPEAPGVKPVQLSNPETGLSTKIAPDDAGWPKAEVTEGLPEGLPEELPDDLPEVGLPEKPELPGAEMPAAKAPEAPKVELPGAPPEVPSRAPKQTQIEGLETGDLTTIAPDDAGWPKADVQRGGLSDLPDGLPKEPPELPGPDAASAEVKPDDLVEQLKDQV